MRKLLKRYLFCILAFGGDFAIAQELNTRDTANTEPKGKLTVEGYGDLYYAYDFNKPADGNRPYFVSMNRHDEVTVNLAYVAVKYSSSNIRARLAPGFGTYMNANYAHEPSSLRHIVEASAGVRISSKRNIWLDAGVFGSPYTNESAISKEHLTYTRSFAPEYVPYYLSGVKVSVPLSSKVNAYLYLLNGWQQIKDQNDYKSIGTQLEFRPGPNLLINWNTYFGKERSASDPAIGMRYFSDVYFVYTKLKWTVTGCFYLGVQKQISDFATWWQANLNARYQFTSNLSVTGRVEYFSDDNSVQIVPVTETLGFSSYSSSLGLNYKLTENVMLRLEGRTFFSTKDVYVRGDHSVNDDTLLTSNVTIWF